MELFWKSAAAVLITVILTLSIEKKEKDIATLLTLAVCCMVGMIVIFYMEPVIDLLKELEEIGDLENEMLSTLLKAVGIALVAEMAGMICADSGNSALCKMMQMLGTIVIVYLSLPIFKAFLALIQEILNGI